MFAFMVVSMIALSMGSLMISNFAVYQVSKAYHVLRERLLIKKMLFQMTEEVVLSKYELANSSVGLDLGSILTKEVNSIASKTKLNFDAFELIENRLTDSNRVYPNVNVDFKNDIQPLSPRIASYLAQGSYTYCGQASFLYRIHDSSYIIQATGYGVPLSNIDYRCYDLPSSLARGGRFEDYTLYCVDSDGETLSLSSVKSDINYKNRKEISVSCNAYEWLWNSDYLEKLAKGSVNPQNTVNHFVLELPYDGDGNGELEDKGVIITSPDEVTLDFGKINFDVVAISDPLGQGKIKIASNVSLDKPLIVISHNNATFNNRTILEIDQSCTRPVVFYLLNTQLVFRNSPQIKGAFFLNPHSMASGEVFLDGHFSRYGRADLLNFETLDLKFNRTDDTKKLLAKMVPHAFLTDISLQKSQK